VYPGREGWLFYRPDVDYVAGPGFLDPAELSHLPKSANPLPALIQFRDDLAARGIRLVLLPVPIKPVIDPEYLSHPIPRGPLQNPSFGNFLTQLQKNAIEFVDASQAMLDSKQSSGRPQFLKTDSHWTPSAMECVARQIAQKIAVTGTSKKWTLGEPREIRNHGDLVAMLRLSDPSALFPLEEATISPVVGPDGTAWTPDPSAEILLLGDSFTNIYSLNDLGWGTGSGLAEHLSLALQKPLDRIAINAGGATTTRQTLARSPERLEGKKIVIYEFAMRDLAVGDWKVLPLPEAKPVAEKPSPSRTGLVGTIKDITRAPKPGTVPYKDLIVCIHLTDIEGGSPAEALVFLHGMKSNIPTAACELNPGDKIHLQSVPWSTVEEKYGAINRKELTGPAAELEDIFWSEEIPEAER
jgi:alginate O-acetyltransferase complex protein AlgJ